MRLNRVSEFMEQAGVPGRDLYDLPSSGKSFPDGCHYRLEISGVEGPRVLEALIKERRKRNIPIHRLVSFCQGGTLFDDAELKDFAQLAAGAMLRAVAYDLNAPSVCRGVSKQQYAGWAFVDT